MIQIVETTDKEKFEMYNTLEKSALIGMLIECNKHLQRITPRVVIEDKCRVYIPGTDTSCRCTLCGKLQWEHFHL
jgi:uncharacterized protein with PIN domain